MASVALSGVSQGVRGGVRFEAQLPALRRVGGGDDDPLSVVRDRDLVCAAGVEVSGALPCGACTWDCGGNDDGIIGVTDLLALLGQYDPQSPVNCTGGSCDFNSDGCVDVVDLLKLLGQWGPCRSGVCCLNDATCIETTLDFCVTVGGTYQGDGTSCALAQCQLLGACCSGDGTCQVLPSADCNGIYQGDGTDLILEMPMWDM